MNIEKINDIIKTLNLTTESMSLYSNVKLEDSVLPIIYMAKGSEFTGISNLDIDNTKLVDAQPQYLQYVTSYIVTVENIQKTINNLLLYCGSEKRGRHIIKSKQELKDSLVESLNACYQYKSLTVELHNRAKRR